jgi:hypothetical protein
VSRTRQGLSGDRPQRRSREQDSATAPPVGQSTLSAIQQIMGQKAFNRALKGAKNLRKGWGGG